MRCEQNNNLMRSLFDLSLYSVLISMFMSHNSDFFFLLNTEFTEKGGGGGLNCEIKSHSYLIIIIIII